MISSKARADKQTHGKLLCRAKISTSTPFLSSAAFSFPQDERQSTTLATSKPSKPPLHQSIKMGRLHSNGKGISASAVPYSRNPPSWLKTTPDQVVEQICKLAKKGATPSQIGVVLRDSHGIAQVKVVTGMLRFLLECSTEDTMALGEGTVLLTSACANR